MRVLAGFCKGSISGLKAPHHDNYTKEPCSKNEDRDIKPETSNIKQNLKSWILAIQALGFALVTGRLLASSNSKNLATSGVSCEGTRMAARLVGTASHPREKQSNDRHLNPNPQPETLNHKLETINIFDKQAWASFAPSQGRNKTSRTPDLWKCHSSTGVVSAGGSPAHHFNLRGSRI